MANRTIAFTAALCVALAPMPAAAALPLSGGLLDAARTILKGRSVLKTGEAKCGGSVALKPEEALLVSLARKGVRETMPASQFIDLDKAVGIETAKEAATKGFCAETKTKKKSILDRVRDAAQIFGIGGGGLFGI